jgi:hypothetical protein
MGLENTEDMYRRIKNITTNLIKKKRWESVASCSKILLKINPYDKFAKTCELIGMAGVLYMQKQYEEGLKYADQALKLEKFLGFEPGQIELEDSASSIKLSCIKALVQKAYSQKKWDTLVRYANQLPLDPRGAKFRLNLARKLFADKQWSPALKLANKASRVYKWRHKALNLRKNILLKAIDDAFEKKKYKDVMTYMDELFYTHTSLTWTTRKQLKKIKLIACSKLAQDAYNKKQWDDVMKYTNPVVKEKPFDMQIRKFREKAALSRESYWEFANILKLKIEETLSPDALSPCGRYFAVVKSSAYYRQKTGKQVYVYYLDISDIFIHAKAYIREGTKKIPALKGIKPLKILSTRQSDIDKIAFSLDGKYLATLGKVIKIWKIIKTFGTIACKLQKTLNLPDHHQPHLAQLAFSRKYFAVGLSNGIIKVWNIPAFDEVKTLSCSQKTAGVIAFSPCGRYLVSVNKNVMKIRDTTRNFECVKTMTTGRVLCVTFSPDTSYLFVSKEIQTEIFEVDMNFEYYKTLSVMHERTASKTLSIAFGPDGNYIATSSSTEISIWDARTFTLLKTIHVGGSQVTFSKDSRYILFNITGGVGIILP